MNKKVIKAMYDYIVSKEEKNPVLTGVHFERERCYASDTRLLAIYNFGSEKHADQTIGVNGEPIKGKYPAVDRIFPKKFSSKVSVDFRQLRSACSWWTKLSCHNANDAVVLGGVAFNIRILSRMLYLFSLTGELGALTFQVTDNAHPAVAHCDSLKVAIMPFVIQDESQIDEERLEGASCVVSYANLINTYALESNKPKAKKAEPMSWL